MVGQSHSILLEGKSNLPAMMRLIRTKENHMRKSSLLLLLFVICVPARAPQTREQKRNKGIAQSSFEEVLDKDALTGTQSPMLRTSCARWRS
jgi:hypothetical protein